ncbi:unnamed protein product, partial [Brassica rapa subsp. trilocularis]
RSPIARIFKKKEETMHEEENMSTLEILLVDFDRAQRDYWRQVRQSEAFDIGNVSIPSNMCGMITGLFPIDCIRERGYPYHVLVNLYAKVGLHRYNMLKVIKNSLLKCNMLQNLIDHQEPLIPHFPGDAVDDGFFKGELPDWPSDDALNDGKRFYLVRLFWQANYLMYLELIICAHDRMIHRVTFTYHD